MGRQPEAPMRSAWLLALTGCNVVIDEATFYDDYPNEMCQRGITCLWPDLPDLDTCVEQRQDAIDDESRCADFDKDAAAACMRALKQVSCDDLDYRFPDRGPSECEDVYVCTGSTTYTTYSESGDTGL